MPLLRRKLERRQAEWEAARAHSCSLGKDARAEAQVAAASDLRTATSRLDGARSSLASALQSAHSARRGTLAGATLSLVAAHNDAASSTAGVWGEGATRTGALRTWLEKEKESAQSSQERIAAAASAVAAHPQRQRSVDGSLPGEAGGGGGGAHHARALSSDEDDDGGATEALRVLHQGYLLKQSSSGLRSDWKRRFFLLSPSELTYFRDDGTHLLDKLGRKEGAGEPLPLLTASLKTVDSGQLRFCFRVVTPSKTLTLQAASAGEAVDWCAALSAAISGALHSSMGCESPPPSVAGPRGGAGPGRTSAAAPQPAPSGAAAAAMLRSLPGNEECCDCGAPSPDWASLNLTALLCVACSGVHRGLGVHVSKVRSLSLDTKVWEEPGLLAAFAAGGNAVVNAVMEARSGAAPQRAAAAGDAAALATFVRSKYASRRFVRPHAARSAPAALRAAVASGDAGDTLRALLCGAPADAPFARDAGGSSREGGDATPHTADPDSQPPSPASFSPNALSPSSLGGHGGGGTPRGGGGSRPVRRASQGGADSPRALLLAASAAAAGRTLLHVAAAGGGAQAGGVLELLLQWGAKVDAADADGVTPLMVACAAASRSPAAAEAARRLLRAGADVSLRDREGRSAREAAADAADDALQNALQAASDDRLASLMRPHPASADDGPPSVRRPGHHRMPSSERLMAAIFSRLSTSEDAGFGASPNRPRSRPNTGNKE